MFNYLSGRIEFVDVHPSHSLILWVVVEQAPEVHVGPQIVSAGNQAMDVNSRVNSLSGNLGEQADQPTDEV